jgi:hypothetical protein
MRGPRAAALLLLAASCAAQNIYDACNFNDAHGTVEKARLLRNPASPLAAVRRRPAHGMAHACAAGVSATAGLRPRRPHHAWALSTLSAFCLTLRRSAAQASGGVPIGLAFWINGKLEDWDPVTVTASNTTVTSDGAYENVTTYRSLHPCNDAAELAAIATPAGIISTTPSGSTEPAPSVRGTRHERARVGGALTRRTAPRRRFGSPCTGPSPTP